MTTTSEHSDPIPFEDAYETVAPDQTGLMLHRFFAFNTVIIVQAFGPPALCNTAFDKVRHACRVYERQFSRTLPHSDISRLNNARGAVIPISNNTAHLLQAAQTYCGDSQGCFDITLGAVVQLWDFHQGIVPSDDTLEQALRHVDWHMLRVWEQNGQAFAQLDDPLGAIDVGGVAKGWIADALAELMLSEGIASFVLNLGGNVVAHGTKPSGKPWRVGLQDPRNKNKVVGAVDVQNASAVTSGIYERRFKQNGALYHHILSPQTGLPVQTDVEGVTVIAQKSLDAEGYSTTLLALGIERGREFVQQHPVILRAYFVDAAGRVVEA